jgi:hypothetical protein
MKQKRINFYVLILVYFILIIGYIVTVIGDIREYYSFNEEKLSNVTNISINNHIVNKKDFKGLFEELKIDEFTWVNHPIKREEYSVKIFTNKRIYKFKILDTYNQGVLIYRINYTGKEYVTNRNDRVLFFLK